MGATPTTFTGSRRPRRSALRLRKELAEQGLDAEESRRFHRPALPVHRRSLQVEAIAALSITGVRYSGYREFLHTRNVTIAPMAQTIPIQIRHHSGAGMVSQTTATTVAATRDIGSIRTSQGRGVAG